MVLIDIERHDRSDILVRKTWRNAGIAVAVKPTMDILGVVLGQRVTQCHGEHGRRQVCWEDGLDHQLAGVRNRSRSSRHYSISREQGGQRLADHTSLITYHSCCTKENKENVPSRVMQRQSPSLKAST